MNINYKTRILKYGQILEQGAESIHRSNRLLSQAIRQMGALRLGGARLYLDQVHFGPGPYPQKMTTALHQHGQLQLEIAVTGYFQFFMPAQRIILDPGDGFAVLPAIPHGWTCLKTGLMMGVLVDTDAKNPEFWGKQWPQRLGTWQSFHGLKVKKSFLNLISLLAERTDISWRSERTGYCLGLWLTDVLAEILPERIVCNKNPPVKKESICQRVDDFLAMNAHRRLQLSDIAAEVGYSLRHLNRLYRRHRGTSIGQAMFHTRLERGYDLMIQHPDMPMKTIAYQCGFSSPSYFTACFRRYFGRTPSKARNHAIREK